METGVIPTAGRIRRENTLCNCER